MKVFSELKKNLKKDFSVLVPLRVAILGDTPTQFIAQALRGHGYEEGFDLQLWEAGFDQIERQFLDMSSDLYEYNPEVVIIFHSTHKLLEKYNRLKPEKAHTLADSRIDLVSNLVSAAKEKLRSKIIYYNYPEINDSIFGNYANKVVSSFLFQQRKLNLMLMEFASKNFDFFVIDLASIQNQRGKRFMFQPSVYINTEIVLSIDVLPEVAKKTINVINSLQGKSIKCIILDLDNTIWGGIIGDDGLENIQIGGLGIGKAFTEFQYWAKKLKNRGIILAVCSKNTESIAKEPFEKHPEMILRLDDIAVFISNWENKVDNIKQIQKILNISFDSMVFLDDNPFERNMVREHIKTITVPELPEDPAEYLEYLYASDLFETVSHSSTDETRTRQYQIEAQRTVIQKYFTNEDDFLKSLNMHSVVEPFNKFNSPRVAQLSQRSNQFNLRTVRYTESEIISLSNKKNYHTFTFSLEDKFGDNGLICVIILKNEDNDSLFIDSWFMSCRVLKRGMEHFVLNIISNYAKENHFVFLIGEYLPTPKNDLVKYHYKNLGFKNTSKKWTLNLTTYQSKKSFINTKNL